ncbi:MAG TPA: hypothetical protein VF395_03290, partial [Polyangiaceae bacterium]
LNLVTNQPVVVFISLEFKEGNVSISDFVRAIEGRNRSARVYAMTSYGSPSIVAETIAAGVDGVLLQPVRVEELIALAVAARDDAPAPQIM